MTDKEDARNWRRLMSNFSDVDFRYLEFFAVKEMNKEIKIVKFG